MTITLPASLLAIDFGGLMAVVFVIFTVLSWISSAVGNQQKPPRPAGQPPRGGGGAPRPPQGQPQRQPQAQARARNPRQERLESEIEAFLQDVVQPRPNAPRAQREIEVVEPEPQREPPRRPTPRRDPVREAPTARREAQPRRPVQPQPERVEPAGQHLSLHAELSEAPTPYVETGTFADAILVGQTGRSTASPVRPADIAALLRSPQGVQQAVLMSEILARPRSLR